MNPMVFDNLFPISEAIVILDISEGNRGSSYTGLITEPDGTILTQADFLYDVTTGLRFKGEVKVILQDRRRYYASVVHIDEPSHYAVLKINDPGPFEAAKVASPSTLSKGKEMRTVESMTGTDRFIVEECFIRGVGTNAPCRSKIHVDYDISKMSMPGFLVNMDGEIVGFKDELCKDSPELYHVTPIETVTELLEQSKKRSLEFPFGGQRKGKEKLRKYSTDTKIDEPDEDLQSDKEEIKLLKAELNSLKKELKSTKRNLNMKLNAFASSMLIMFSAMGGDARKLPPDSDEEEEHGGSMS